MAIEAEFDGVCPNCEQRITAGVLIETDHSGEWAHVVCPGVKKPIHPVCQTCWIEHPLGDCE